ncbi:unnamed protein product [Gordionus sp. m RMFG-2023]|uniref:CCA tRNA nucleotidyltransferase 1, mitochondrial-like n=1 Tax=Gordionus sp. m RMFG-2023 TaxID=3053472 RepID=UPI0030E26F5C
MNISHFDSFKAIFTPEVNKLKEIFARHNYPLRLAGGPVRDILLGVMPEDLDFATPATPDQMKNMFATERLVILVNKNGERHGTITVMINDKQKFEITTLRIDKTTDGRHANVQFTDNWVLDASRRDLTINSMFLDFGGTLYDYFGGKKDLDEKRIAFVGDAQIRMQEDYLRILRYLRFYGKISNKENNHDPKIVKAITENGSGLANIAGERIWSELKKICAGNYIYSLLKLIFDTGMSRYIGLPAVASAESLRELYRVCEATKGLNPNPITILATVLTKQDINVLDQRLKLTNSEQAILDFIIEERRITQSRSTKYYIDLMIASQPPSKTREKIIEYLKYSGKKNELKDFLTASAKYQ